MSFFLRLLLLATALLLSSCDRKLPLHEEQGYVFGTLVDISIYGEEEGRAQKAVASVMQEFQRLHNLLHAWQPSELSSLNDAIAKGRAREMPPEIVAMLKDAAQVSQQGGGLFNPAIGRLIRLWGFQADEFKAVLPDEKQVKALLAANPQMSDLTFDGNRVGSKNPAVMLDLGGYAKGYALDRAAELLKRQGIRNALINIGGNVLALGRHGDREWRVGIQNPRKPGPLAMLSLHDGEAIGTSGDYQRYFELGGRRYCHLIDPRSGYPAQGIQAVTILAHGPRSGTLSDAPSKPLFISGVAGWREAARKMNIDEALLIDAQGVVHLTAGMQKRLEFEDNATPRKVEP